MTLIALLLFFFSCTKNSEKPILTLPLDANVASLDPIHATDRYSIQGIFPAYECLFEYDYLKRPYELTPLLVESFPQVSQDKKIYRFKLKKGIFFHPHEAFKGPRELRVEDIFYSFKRLADKKLQAKGWWVLQGKILGLDAWREGSDYSVEVPGFKKINEQEFEIILIKPYPQILHLLANVHTAIVAQEVVEFYKNQFGQFAIGTGPFILKKFIPGNSLHYIKNENYQHSVFPENNDPNYSTASLKKLPLTEELIFLITPENHPRWLNFLKGSFDLFYGLSADPALFINEQKSLKKELVDKKIKAQSTLILDVSYLGLNNKNPIFKNPLVRKALSLSIDRDKYSELFLYGLSEKAQSVVPPAIKGYQNKKNSWIEYNPKLAEELLVKAGYPKGQGLPILRLETKSGTEDRQKADFFAKAFQAIGVKVKINYNTWPELINKIHRGNNDIFTLSWHMDYPDAENMFSLVYGKGMVPKGNNYTFYENKIIDALFEEAIYLEDGPRKTSLYEQIDDLIREEVPIIYLFHRKVFWLYHDWLKFFKDSDFDFQHVKYYSIDPERKKKVLKNL